VALALSLTAARGRSLLVMLAVVATAVATFLALAMLTKVITGRETLTYYHHQVAVLATATLLLAVAGQPILPYLDQTILGVGLFLAGGRIGCLLVGCCHGRPASWGVRYGEAHAAAGFPVYLVGVRLLPVQVAESLWVLAVVAAGTALMLAGAAPGVALAWYISAYAVGRFFLELARGDAGRVYLLGFSEAQWTSLAMPAAVLAGTAAGMLPLQRWGAAGTAVLTCATALVVGRRALAPMPSHRAVTAKVLAGLIVRLRRQDGGHDVVAGRRARSTSTGSPSTSTAGASRCWTRATARRRCGRAWPLESGSATWSTWPPGRRGRSTAGSRSPAATTGHARPTKWIRVRTPGVGAWRLAWSCCGSPTTCNPQAGLTAHSALWQAPPRGR
jgi:hypothetical protein